MNRKVAWLVVIPGLVLVLFSVAWACGYRANTMTLKLDSIITGIATTTLPLDATSPLILLD